MERRGRDQATRAYAHHPGSRGELEAILLGWLSLGSFGFLLNRIDKDAIAHRWRHRLPFLDRELVELVVNLPLEHRVGPAPKGLLRDVARRHIPRAIVRRPKQMGLIFDTRRRIEEAARPAFLEGGLLRDLLGVALDDWRRTISRPASGRGCGRGRSGPGCSSTARPCARWSGTCGTLALSS